MSRSKDQGLVAPLRPAVRREAVHHGQERWGFSECSACRLIGIQQSVARYQRVGNDTPELREQLCSRGCGRRRFGYRRLWVLLRRKGFGVNRKTGLPPLPGRVAVRAAAIRLRCRRRTDSPHAGTGAPKPARVDGLRVRHPRQWPADPSADRDDDFTRESLATEVDISLPALRVTQVLDRLAVDRGLPELFTVDNGPEFAGRVHHLGVHSWVCSCTSSIPASPFQSTHPSGGLLRVLEFTRGHSVAEE